MENEIWLPVIGYEGLYEVSSFGRIKSLPKYKYCFGHKKLRGERIMNFNKPRKCRGKESYLFVTLIKLNKIRSTYAVHRLVAIAFIANPENKPEVNHKDTNKLNNHKDNLEWKTRAEHVIHTNQNIVFNRQIGEKHVRSKISENQAMIIKEMVRTGNYESYAQIGRIFGLHRHSVRDIITGKNWKHLKNE